MEQKIAQFINKGMQQDYSISKASNEFAFKNHNIRITTRGENSLLTVTNEKSNKEIPFEFGHTKAFYDDSYSIGAFTKMEFENPRVLSKIELECRVVSKKGSTRPSPQNKIITVVFDGDTYNGFLFEDYLDDYITGIRILNIYKMYIYADTDEAPEVLEATKREDNTLYFMSSNEIEGVTLGYAVANNEIILFTKSNNKDYIYSVDVDNKFYKVLYSGNLNFSLDNAIETLYNYESEKVEKVYWVDGINPPRVINIKGKIQTTNDSQFDFNPIANTDIIVDIKKQYGGEGLFPSGVIQYIVAYYNDYMQESSPVYISPIYYLTNADRGTSPEDTVSCNFIVECSNLDTNWDNVILYSLQRSSLNSTVLAYKVDEYSLKNLSENSKITFVDTNTQTETVDATRFLFDGDNFIPSTIASKAEKLFFGDLQEVNKEDLTFVLKDNASVDISFGSRSVEYPNYGGTYDYKFQLNEGENSIKTFKGGEKYRIALQLQDNKGIWSSPIYLKDLQNDIYPKRSDKYVELSCINTKIPYNTLVEAIPNFDSYSRARLLMAEPTIADRTVLAQGILSPTVYNMLEVTSGVCHNANSWIQRFTTIDKHLTNVNHKAIKDGKLVNPFYLELPVDKKEGLVVSVEKDVTSYYNNVTSSNTKKANIVSVNMTMSMWGLWDGGIGKNASTIILSRDKVVVNIYDNNGTLLEANKEIPIELATEYGKYFFSGYTIYNQYKGKKFKKDLEALYNSISLYINSVKFSDEYHVVDSAGMHTPEKMSFYKYIKKVLGDDVEILNVKETDYLLRDAEIAPVFMSSFEDIYEKFYQAYSSRKDLEKTTGTVINRLSTISPAEIQKEQTESKNNYFVDANKVTIYSPDLENVTSDSIKFRIVGCAPLRHNISSYDIEVNNTNGIKTSLNFILDEKGNYHKEGKYLRSHYLYWLEHFLTSKGNDGKDLVGSVLMSLWQKSGALSNNKEENILKRKVIGNLWYCDTDYYTDNGNTRILWDKKELLSYKQALDSTISFKSKIYKKDYENLLLPAYDGFEHLIKNGATQYESIESLEKNLGTLKSYKDETFNGCLIKYSSEKHGVIELPKNIILPGFSPEINNIASPVKLSTGESLTPTKDKRFLPMPFQVKVDSIPNVGEEPKELTITVKETSNSAPFAIPKNSYIVVVYWTESELRSFLAKYPYGYASIFEEVSEVLSLNNLTSKSRNQTEEVAKMFLEQLIYTVDSNGYNVKRIAIYHNTKDSTYSHTRPFELVGSVMNISEFISEYKDVATYPKNYDVFNSENNGIISNGHAENCKAAIRYNLPCFIYNPVTQVVSSESDKFEYTVGNKFWNVTPCVWIGEIYRDGIEVYGGNNDLSIANTKYIVCSDTYDLETESDLEIQGTIGDTYFQRWDCLRTYPTTEEDINSVVDIVSVMIESRTNLDGRYDNNRGRLDVHMNRPTNMNLYNSVYSQQNNFFSYNSVDIRNINNSLSNCYTWSLSKTNNELIDSWTKGLMVNVNNVDGSKGKITKLQLWKDYLLLFQEKGIARIHYNDQTTIGTVEGVPVEIANSQTVLGHNYLSEAVGCHNKWTIIPTESGIYFVDSINKSINIFNGNVLNLSYNKSFKDWGTNNLNSIVWSPNNLDGYKASFDFKNRDYYLTNKDSCLSFSEELQSFASFYDYTESPIMFNFKDKFIGIQSKEDSSILWDQFAGDDYCNFYGEQKDYSVEFNVNPNPLNDKIFTTLEYRAYVDNTDDTFDNVEAFNEYQHGEANPNIGRHKYPNAEKKFRIWRLDVPRDKNSRRGLDRIRNPWMKLKLTKSNNTNNRMNFHDLLVRYYE